MRSLNFTLGASLLPSFSLVSGTSTTLEDCYGKICHAIEEYCSAFTETCDRCANICDASSHNFHADQCAKLCTEFNKFEPLKAEIDNIQQQQTTILILLIVLLILIVIRYAYKCIRWLRNKRYVSLMLKKLQPKKYAANQNGKDLGATTIQNVMTINDMERAPSQIYSITGMHTLREQKQTQSSINGAEGSVMTVTTPVSTRYPAENSTTPTTIPTEYSYVNEALVVTPVSEKTNGTHAF